jgi:hypothetical protein
MELAVWCHSLLRSPGGQPLLNDNASTIGSQVDADLAGWYEQLELLNDATTVEAMQWLTVDRGIARHFQVAARKLVQHDTFRLIEDENGVHATQNCPVANIAIRIQAMLSLMTDVGLLRRTTEGYASNNSTKAWLNRQMTRL